MTKYPIVFVTGLRSLFFHEKLGGGLQDFIAAHGYTVLSPAMPFRSQKLRKRYLEHWFKQQTHQRYHFILSEKTYTEFKDLFDLYKDSTFTLAGKQFSESKSNPPMSYRLHQLFCLVMGSRADHFTDTLQDKSTEFLERFLDHCIELAENEDI